LGLHIYGGDEEETDGAGEIFVVILRRTCFVSKSSAFSDVLLANEKQKKNSTVRRLHIYGFYPLAKGDEDKSMQAGR
jgi:hypothetical protein